MTRTTMPRNCKVFLKYRELTRHAILWSQINSTKFDSTKWPTALVRKIKGRLCSFEADCVDHFILLVQLLYNHLHFIQTVSTTFHRATRLMQGNLSL